MEFKVKEVKNLKYMNEEGSIIDMDVLFEGREFFLPFSANPNDNQEHGRTLFERAKNGEFGKVAPYTVDQGRLRFFSTISFLEFRNRFTKDELISIRTATMEVPELYVAWEDIQVTGEVVLIDEDVRANMELFYTHKVLTKKRINELLKV